MKRTPPSDRSSSRRAPDSPFGPRPGKKPFAKEPRNQSAPSTERASEPTKPYRRDAAERSAQRGDRPFRDRDSNRRDSTRGRDRQQPAARGPERPRRDFGRPDNGRDARHNAGPHSTGRKDQRDRRPDFGPRNARADNSRSPARAEKRERFPRAAAERNSTQPPRNFDKRPKFAGKPDFAKVRDFRRTSETAGDSVVSSQARPESASAAPVVQPEREPASRPFVKPRAARPARAPQPLPQAHQAGTIMVDHRAAMRLRSGNPWVYRSDIVSAEGVDNAALAPVLDERGRFLGSALYSGSSQIALRMISPERIVDDQQLLELVRERIRTAIAYRGRVVENTDAYRVVFSEADFLPGLIVDRYNDVLSVQVLTQAMDREDIRQAVISELAQHFSPAGIVERVDPRIRELEQLPPRESALLYGERSATTFTMNGIRFQFDALAGQKTGAFLDQRENYAAAERYAHGEALDVFCYQGGFALHLARACDQVTGADISRPALEHAERNASSNPEALQGREIDWLEANAFDLLRDYADAGQKYDTIVLDPPAFAKTRKTLETALRGYKELNLRALKMLRPGGTLVTCSCSYHVSEADFVQMLAEAAADAHRFVRIVEKRGQAKDHPMLLALPESQYLKCVIALVE